MVKDKANGKPTTADTCRCALANTAGTYYTGDDQPARTDKIDTAIIDQGPGWTLYDRTDANPVDEAVLASYILKRSGGGDYFKLSIDFEIQSGLGAGLQYVINDGLAGWNCGANQANCP